MEYVRLGRKQKRAILDENGLEVALFREGFEDAAAMVVELINNKLVVEKIWAEEMKMKCPKCLHKYTEPKQLKKHIKNCKYETSG